MGVNIEKAGEQGVAIGIYDLSPGRRLHLGANIDNPIVPDDDRAAIGRLASRIEDHCPGDGYDARRRFRPCGLIHPVHTHQKQQCDSERLH